MFSYWIRYRNMILDSVIYLLYDISLIWYISYMIYLLYLSGVARFHLMAIPMFTTAASVPFLIARFMGPTWGPSGADRTQMGPMLAPWTLLSGVPLKAMSEINSTVHTGDGVQTQTQTQNILFMVNRWLQRWRLRNWKRNALHMKRS